MNESEQNLQAIEKLNESLNPEQRQAAEQIYGPVMVIAGAGAGKTKTLIHRVATMIAKGISPTSIVVVSFTRKAATELEERLEAMVGEHAQHIISGTFHSVVFDQIIKRNPDSTYLASIGLDPTKLSFMAEDDSVKVMKRIIKELPEKDQKYLADKEVNHSGILGKMGLERAMGRDVNMFARSIEPGEDDEILKLIIKECWTKYNAECRASFVVDFDDALLFADRMLAQEPHIAKDLSRQMQYVMLDEYQDTNRVQMNIFDAIAQHHKNICVVGDEKQSIYKFRGAEIGVILSFVQRYPGAVQINMNRNYRSLGPIINASNGCAKHMDQKLNDGQLISMKAVEDPDGGSFEMLQCKDQNVEARAIVSEIIKDLKAGVKPNDIAVLYRNRTLKDVLEQQLIANKIDYMVVGNKTIFESKAVKDLVAMIKFIFNPWDNEQGKKFIDRVPLGLSLNMANDMLKNSDQNLFSVIEELSEKRRDAKAKKKGEELPPYTAVALKLQPFVKISKKLRECVYFMDDPKYIREVIAFLWDKYLKESALRHASNQAGKGKKKDGKVDSQVSSKVAENIKFVLDRIEDELVSGMTMDEVLNDLIVMSDSRLRGSAEEENQIQLLTIHASKGLEWPSVYIIGANNFTTPGDNVNYDDIEEERRLIYVGATRGQRKVVLSSPDNMIAFGTAIKAPPSQFMTEIRDTVGIPIKRIGHGFDMKSTSGF